MELQEVKSLKRKLGDEGNDHEKKSKTENRFQCDICFKNFTLKQNLTRHVRSHSSFFQCSLCDRNFKEKNIFAYI